MLLHYSCVKPPRPTAAEPQPSRLLGSRSEPTSDRQLLLLWFHLGRSMSEDGDTAAGREGSRLVVAPLQNRNTDKLPGPTTQNT